ncbi:MAG: NYN domain-containing protein, partial [Microcoleaceae cyanobacterium]
LSVHFTDYGQTADTFIEKFCATCRHQFKISGQRLIVATSDRVQRLTVEGYGAELMSAQQLAQAVDHIARRYHRRYKSGKQTTSRFLFSSLDPEAQKRLTKMRMGHKD